MKILMLIVMILISASNVYAFDYGDLSVKLRLNLLRTNEKNFESRINIITDAEYKILFFKGEYNLDYNNDYDFTRNQQKSLIGIKIYDEFSLRYQYENYESDSYTTVPEKIVKGELVPAYVKVKNTSWHDNRYGAGYKFKFELPFHSKGSMDIMALKEDRYDYRIENNIVIDTKYIAVRNQVYWDYDDFFHMQRYYDRILIHYKITEHFWLNTQNVWQTDKPITNRIGVTIVF